MSRMIKFGLATILAASVSFAAHAGSSTFDMVVVHVEGTSLKRGTVIDGSGAAGVRADVGVVGDRIAGVGDFSGCRAAARVDAEGLVVTPGFIDVHTHDDRLVLSSPDMAPKISQGVTTVVAGNCGVSLAPLVDRDPPPPMNLLGEGQIADYVNSGAWAAKASLTRSLPPNREMSSHESKSASTACSNKTPCRAS